MTKHRTLFLPVFCLALAAFQGAVVPANAEGMGTQSENKEAVETGVTSALHMDKGITNAGDISVENKEGTVILSGTVANTMEAERAVKAARGVAGVKGVEDKLVRKSTSGVEASPHQSEAVGAPLQKNRHQEEGTTR